MVPGLGEAYASHLSGELDGNSLKLSWKSYSSKAKAKIWATSTNQFKYGETDIYRLVGEVSLADQEDVMDLKIQYENLKVVMELPNGFINVWVTNKE